MQVTILRRGERIRVTGKRGQRGGYFGKAGTHVCRGSAGLAAAVGAAA
jgi:hypothetical protein